MSDKRLVAANIELSQMQDELQAMNQRGLEAATAMLRYKGQVKLLTMALEKYAFHAADCARRQMHECSEGTFCVMDLNDEKCTCGLAEIVTPDPVPEAPKSSIIITGE